MEVLLLLIGAGAWYYYQNAQSFKQDYKIEFRDGSFDYQKTQAAGFTKIYCKIRIYVINPTSFTGTFNSASFNIIYNQSQLGTANIRTPVTVKPNATTLIEIPIALPTLSLISNIEEIITAISKQQSIIFNITGALVFSIGTLNINTSYKVPLVYQ